MSNTFFQYVVLSMILLLGVAGVLITGASLWRQFQLWMQMRRAKRGEAFIKE